MLGVLESCRVATIAVIAGACTSAGLAACGDMRIDTAAARIGFPIAKTLGNCLSMSNVSRLVTLFGSARTKDIIFIARLIEAPEALAHGLLNEVALDAHALQRCASELAQLLASHARWYWKAPRRQCAACARTSSAMGARTRSSKPI